MRKALRYVERNPVRGEIAERTADYRWSSAAAHLAGKESFGVLDWSEWERLGNAEGWAGLLATPEEREQTRLLRRCTYAGRPFGEEEFLAEMEEQFGRRWRRWGFEGKRNEQDSRCCRGCMVAVTGGERGRRSRGAGLDIGQGGSVDSKDWVAPGQVVGGRYGNRFA